MSFSVIFPVRIGPAQAGSVSSPVRLCPRLKWEGNNVFLVERMMNP